MDEDTKPGKRRQEETPLDLVAIERKFEPDYTIDLDGTVILFRATVLLAA